MTSWAHIEDADGWEGWEKACADMGAVVKSLKDAKADKETIEPAVAELLARKEKFREALEAAIATADDATKATLTAKLPPVPKDKKGKKDKGAAAPAVDAEKEANKKENERLKAEARAKKKAEAEAKKAGGATAAPAAAAKPAATAPATAAKPAAAKPAAVAAPAPAAAPTVPKKTVSANKNTELHFIKESPPLLAILTARLAKQELVLKRVEAKQLPESGACVLLLSLGQGRLHGDAVAARYFARLLPTLYGAPGDALSAARCDEYIDLAEVLAKADGAAMNAMVAELNQKLAMRASLAGHGLSLADAAVWLALKKNASAAKLASSGGAGPHVRRWLKFVESSAAVAAINQDFFGVQKDMGSTDNIRLKGAEMGKVVTRFPPEPSGHLHIGHVKACLLNAHYASAYNGKMLLRFDDTNPSKEKEEYEEAIVKDLERLSIVPFAISHTSDFFPQIEKIAVKMIKDGLAYVDPSPQEEQQKGRYEKKDSVHRTATIEENLRLFNEMRNASEEGLKCCLRAKINMQADNGSLRDPTIYRCNLQPHARTKDTHKIYPNYDLACPIVDSLEGVTHALRDRQYSDRDEQYQWFIDKLKLRPVNLEGFSRINFVRCLLSKRKLQWMIDHKFAEGWDDPRFPTVSGVLRRGMTVEGLKQFILSMGASKNSNLMTWDKIWAFNRSIIDPTSARYVALLSAGLVTVTIDGAPAEPFAQTLFKHPKDESLGKKTRLFAPTVLLQADDAETIAEGEEVTLMSWGNVIVNSITRDAKGKPTAVKATQNFAGDVRKTKKKLTWLADTPDLVDVELIDLDMMITKDKPEEEDKVEDLITPNSYRAHKARGEAALRTLKKGETIQVERRGFYVCDEPYVRPADPIRFFFVPDGKKFFGF